MEYQKVKNQRKNKRYTLLILVGIFFLCLGSFVLVYNHYQKEKQQDLDNKLVEEFFEDKVQEELSDENKENNEIEKKEEDSINYIAVLEIPKVNLKRGLVDKNSPYNNVNKNIYILKETILPDEEDISHVLLASHSGNSSVSYFRNLKKLNVKDKVNLYYKNVKYIYEVSKKYEIEKTGKMALSKTDISDITLITCISGTNKQLVFVAKLIDTQDY